MTQLRLQSPFSFRRLAPAVDYLGSPFSSFHLSASTLFWAFLPGFPRIPLSSMHPLVPFVPFTMHLRILSFLFFLSALHRFRLPVAFPTPRSRLSAPADLPLSPCLVSHTVLPVLLIQLAVCFLSLFPASLPQPFHRCSLLRPFVSSGSFPRKPMPLASFRPLPV